MALPSNHANLPSVLCFFPESDEGEWAGLLMERLVTGRRVCAPPVGLLGSSSEFGVNVSNAHLYN